EAIRQIVGDTDHHARLALLGRADEDNDAGAECPLALIRKRLQVLGRNACHDPAHEADTADLLPAGARILRAAAKRELLAGLAQLALQLAALLEQRFETGNDLPWRHLQH